MSVFLQKGSALQAGDLAAGLARELARVREEPQDLALVCRDGEQVHVSRRLLALWSPLVRAAMLEATSILLPDFPSTSVLRLTSLLLPGWEEQVVTREEVEVLEALAIPFTNLQGGKEKQQHLADSFPPTAPEVEIKEEPDEPDEPDDAVEVDPFDNADSLGSPSSRKEQVEQLKAQISKIEKINEKKRTTSQKANLLLFLEEYLKTNEGQPCQDMTKHKMSKKLDSREEHKSIKINSKFVVFGKSKKTRKHLGDTQNTQTKDTKNEKLEAVPKENVKPLMVLIDCDQCKMKFLNGKSLMMHKRTEHRSVEGLKKPN